MRLPFVERTDLDVFRKGDELFVRDRLLQAEPASFPRSSSASTIQEASFVEDRLEVRFGTPAAPAGGGSKEEGEEASG